MYIYAYDFFSAISFMFYIQIAMRIFFFFHGKLLLNFRTGNNKTTTTENISIIAKQN